MDQDDLIQEVDRVDGAQMRLKLYSIFKCVLMDISVDRVDGAQMRLKRRTDLGPHGTFNVDRVDGAQMRLKQIFHLSKHNQRYPWIGWMGRRCD